MEAMFYSDETRTPGEWLVSSCRLDNDGRTRADIPDCSDVKELMPMKLRKMELPVCSSLTHWKSSLEFRT